jgi:hypothetical protein
VANCDDCQTKSEFLQIIGALTRANIQLSDFALGAPSLDDVFFTLTGKPPEKPVAT